MPESPVILQVRRRLVSLACSPTLAQRHALELADHRDDLKREALEEGLTETAAEARADELLGEPFVLAQQMAAVLRKSSWWGRHPILCFCILPPFAVLFLLGMILWLESIVSGFYINSDLISTLMDDPSEMRLFKLGLAGTYYVAILLAVLAFCFLARRTISGLRWTFIACAICALHGCFLQMDLGSHYFSIGYNYPGRPDWWAISIPLAFAAIFWWRQRRLNMQFGGGNGEWKRPRNTAKLNLPRTGFVTPTSLIAALILAALLVPGYMSWRGFSKWQTRQAELRAKVWPAERAAIAAQIALRQSIKETTGETTIDLKSKINATLTDSYGGKPDVAGNTLTSLPAGVHIFGGVPFDVEGRVQLWGTGYGNSGRVFPERIRNIPVARKCRNIYLLHSAAFAHEDVHGKEVARLVLHYTDGSQTEMQIKAGEHLQDWWGPIYKTRSEAILCTTTAPGTELAWTGENAWIKKQQPESSLRLYKSTFRNPHPEREISGIDYVSTMTEAAPFLVGMTVE